MIEGERTLESYIKEGDCLDIMKEIPDGSVDMVLCDLPYGVTACKWDEVIPFDQLWPEYERICKSNGVIVLFGTEPFASMCRMSNLKRYRYDWIWIKARSAGYLSVKSAPLKKHENIMVFYSSDIMNDTTLFFKESKDWLISEKEKAEAAGYNMKEVLGNYMGSHYFTRKTQFAFPKYEDYLKLRSTGFFRREYDDAKRDYDEAKREYDDAKRVTYNPQMVKGKKHIRQPQPIEVYGNKATKATESDLYYPTTMLQFASDNDGYHPTQKPVQLLEYLIKTYTNEGEIVLDNCMGSGSTCVAAVNTDRKYIGYELDHGYFETAKARIVEAEEKHANGAESTWQRAGCQF